jgi:uncharacterized metal-binding protein YceD (DUF177 family)
MAGELAWEHRTDDIPATGLTVQREAELEERQRIVAALDLAGCPELRVHYAITPLSLGRYKLTGGLHARVEQVCVVTLEPMTSEIEETYEAMYWPQQAMPEPAAGQVELDGDPEPEPIIGERIDAGRIVFESLAATIDPFPRQPGAVFEGTLSAPKRGEPESPFAVLASLKPKA